MDVRYVVTHSTTYLRPGSEGMPLHKARDEGGEGVMCLLRTVVSSLGADISLIGQNSMSALFSGPTGQSRTVTTSRATCEHTLSNVMPNADFSLLPTAQLLTLTILVAASEARGDAVTASNIEFRQKKTNKLSSSQNNRGVQITPGSFLCSYNLDIMCNMPESDTLEIINRNPGGQRRCTLKSKLHSVL